MQAEEKIDKLIEEALSNKMKAAAVAGLGGMVGAGLDVYFNGGRNIGQFAKPLAAWGIGGALSGVLSSDNKESATTETKPKE